MTYIELQFRLSENFLMDIIIAELAEAGFGSFAHDDNILKAYIPANKFVEDNLLNCYFMQNYKDQFELFLTVIHGENWNKKWEENFEPVVVDDKIYVRAPFHPPRPEIPMEILIMPKMSFGTGHHSTTYLMLKQMLSMSLNEKTVADLGCGSGILAIAAAKLGAKSVSAVDIDDWCFHNAQENAASNNVKNMVIKQGTAVDLEGKFDVVLANINRNVLLAEMDIYADLTRQDGLLVLSGFYREDKLLIDKSAKQSGFRYEREEERNNWLTLVYRKN